MFKCPVCGKNTISFSDKFKTDYKVKTTITCRNCNSELIESSLGMIQVIIDGLVGLGIFLSNMNILIKIMLFGISFIIILLIGTYVTPIVKYKK
ncbi:hypothetical protein IMX26_03445 [Clostridium sp. 'deep sea']|uniref:hypothetical protein n=1 Tax=Clostridium sp. 'deep sea' TaxID=2779445 RepID=UPI00189677A7|nr:hypothetical protein [Clostridium sp. 'deep sea']QOR35886.1 hypothetical protein IMX26_03445 [Clostridium sp. 'deep sea']